MILKYLFQATYKSGEVFHQTQDDTSKVDPLKSAFFDVKQDELQSFFLISDKDTFSVNLEDGHFEVNGVPFFMHAQNDLTNYRLIYYRVRTHHFNPASGEQTEEPIIYQLGWQTNNKEGKNIKRIMEIQ